MNIEVRISRKSVMGIVEGISVTISQHNGGSPTFEQLWASDGESAKLDIYYREAISDLERRLSKQLAQSSSQWDLQAEGADYVLRLTVAESWPTRLHGLLSNKVQDYLVHTVTAGWLNDFESLSVKQDYQSMAAADLEDVAYLAGLKSFAFGEKARADEEVKGDNSYTTEAGSRGADSEKGENDYVTEAGSRSGDADKVENEYTTDAGTRGTDSAKGDNTYATSAGKRSSADSGKGVNAQAVSAEKRHDGSDEAKADADGLLDAGGRHEDDAEVRRRHEWVDWSGTHPFPPERRGHCRRL